jgi:hypothetical protein
MGNFNTTPNPSLDKLFNRNPTTKSLIYDDLSNFTDSYRILNPSSIKFTYCGPSQHSRIDQIWISNNIANYISQAKIIETNLEFKSDHKIITTSIIPFYIINSNSRKPKPTIIKLEPSRLNEEKWKEIQKNIKLPIQHLLSLSNNPQTLWNSFQTIIETKIIPQIPQKKIKINHQNLFNKKGTLYHK